MAIEGSPENGEGHEMHVAKESHGGEEYEERKEHKAHDMGKQPEKAQKMRHGRHEGHVTEDFKRRFIISLILTIPILVLSPFIQGLFGFELEFPGSIYVLFLLSTLVYFYGGYPFLKGFFREVRDNDIGMMTLIAVAISAAYFYSSAVAFGLQGRSSSGSWQR